MRFCLTALFWSKGTSNFLTLNDKQWEYSRHCRNDTWRIVDFWFGDARNSERKKVRDQSSPLKCFTLFKIESSYANLLSQPISLFMTFEFPKIIQFQFSEMNFNLIRFYHHSNWYASVAMSFMYRLVWGVWINLIDNTMKLTLP